MAEGRMTGVKVTAYIYKYNIFIRRAFPCECFTKKLKKRY